jgi:16S rRNA U1498 N3-methylase RsmE
MLQSNFTPLKIGNWVLRVETAAVAGMVRLMGLNNAI